MLTYLGYIWLAGFLGLGTVNAVQCEDGSRIMSKNECIVVAVGSAAVWPVIAGYVAYVAVTK
jgi:hypothetical protein